MTLITKNESGYTLLETVLSIAMVAFLIPGLFLTWELADSRSRGLDEYTQVKDELETAYEIIARTVRSQARYGSTAITGGGKVLTFTDTNGVNISYFLQNGNLIETRATVQRILIPNVCNNVNFTASGRKITIQLVGITPPTWQGISNDLTIEGHVYIRN